MSDTHSRQTSALLGMVYFIYFFCGMTLCFEGVFLPEFKEYFNLNYQQQMYTMFAKNIPFVIAIGIGYFLKRIGYKNCLTVALFLYAAGTFLLVPGLNSGRYEMVLLAFFAIGIGFNFQLVAGNPLLSALGAPSGGSSRLNLGNALGAIAQIIAPLTLTFIIPATVTTVQAKLPYIKTLFVVISVILLLIAILTLILKNVDLSEGFKTETPDANAPVDRRSLWAHPQVTLGFLTIFLILGAEAGLFGFYRNFLEDPNIAGLTSHQSQRMFTIYFAVFALGRVVGSWVQKRMKPSATLAFCLVMAVIFMGMVMTSKGTMAVVSITALGFFVSIFFPTLYSLAIEGLGDLTAQASGLLTMGFLGCALLPVLQGRLADSVGIQHSFGLCLAAYLAALLYTLKGRRIAGIRRADA